MFFLVTYFAYHYISLFKYKTTVGKFAFKIHLKNIWGYEEVTHTQSAKYAIWKTLGILSLGLTYIGAFVDDRRRTLHEKMSDTMVVTKKQKYSPSPTIREKQFFKGLLLPAQSLLGVLVIYALTLIYNSAQKEIMDASLETSLQPKCEWVEQEFSGSKESSRVAFSMSLYLLSEVDRSCLEKEARAAFEAGENLEEANMAFALIYPEQKESFLHEACTAAPGSFSCVNNLKAKAEYKKPHQVLWQAKELFSKNKYEESLSLLNQIKSAYFSDKLGYFKFKNYWKIKPTEMMSNISSFSSLIEEDTFDRVIAWACLDSAESDCDSAPSFCSKILDKKDFTRAGLEEELSYVRLRECKNQWSEDLPEAISLEAANLFYAKSRLRKYNDLRPLRDMLAGSASYDVKSEIASTMIRYGDLSRDDKEMLGRFKAIDSNRQPASSE